MHPGCDELLVVGRDAYQAKVKIKVGPVSTRFTGKVAISGRDPLSEYRLSGKVKKVSLALPRAVQLSN
jgi:carbon monoxide dehydrogenase subunit G